MLHPSTGPINTTPPTFLMPHHVSQQCHHISWPTACIHHFLQQALSPLSCIHIHPCLIPFIHPYLVSFSSQFDSEEEALIFAGFLIKQIGDFKDQGLMTNHSKRQNTINLILPNIKYRWPELFEKYTNNQIAAAYEDFNMSADAGNNDAKFPEWFDEIGSYPKDNS